MTSVHVPCPTCHGENGWFSSSSLRWVRCSLCEGLGRWWAPGAPEFGCSITLADRDPGEIVTLGNGDRGRILWHMPRKSKKVRPETTFLGLLDEFTDREDHRPILYPSCVGVASVDVSRATIDHDAHDHEKAIDYTDPVHRQIAGRLI